MYPDDLKKVFLTYKTQNQACGVRLHVHLYPEDEARRSKVKETLLDEVSRETIHLLYNTKRHCIL